MSHFLNQKNALFGAASQLWNPGELVVRWRSLWADINSWCHRRHEGRHIHILPFGSTATKKNSGWHPGRLTWNLKISHPKRKVIFQPPVFRFYVNLWGCTIWVFPPKIRGSFPQNGWFIYNGKAYFSMDDLGIPFFFGSTHFITVIHPRRLTWFT